jgi:hypothetical protein
MIEPIMIICMGGVGRVHRHGDHLAHLQDEPGGEVADAAGGGAVRL